MPQTVTTPDTWTFKSESIEIIPLVVKIDGVATTSYTIACPPYGTDPTSFGAPTSFSGGTGYLVNGPVLGKGLFFGYVKFTSSPETPVIPAFRLYIY